MNVLNPRTARDTRIFTLGRVVMRVRQFMCNNRIQQKSRIGAFLFSGRVQGLLLSEEKAAGQRVC